MTFDLNNNSDVIRASAIHKTAHDLSILYLKDEISKKNIELEYNNVPSLNASKIVEEYDHLRQVFIEALQESSTYL